MFSYSNMQFASFRVCFLLLLMNCYITAFASDKPSWSVELPKHVKSYKPKLILQNVNPHLKNSRKEIEQDIIKVKPKHRQLINLVTINIDTQIKKNETNTVKSKSRLNSENNSQQKTDYIQPKLIKRINPRYPIKELKEKKQGWVDLMLEISKSGTVLQSKLIKQSEDKNRNFLRAALRVVKLWKYEPSTIKNTLKIKIHISFKLP